MEQRRVTVQRTGTYYGIMTGIAAVIYMAIVKMIGQMENSTFHFLTGVILVVGVVWAIKGHKERLNGRIKYLEGIGVAFFVGLVSSVIFTIVQVLVDSLFDMAYSYPYYADNGAEDSSAIALIAITWIIFGIVVGPFVGYLAMQYFKSPDHKLTD
ncbi:DUF4199 domain-containing protein [Rufibacter roseus]|uniref:DUF4199 domain-containing protein n=1 Tax=Rufibacter roseus TaxID=1567108 RepID=A0ABW2DPW3_9BACT|nr:DUF4199 domain-containing protein [Rufibacter roseus]